MALPLFFTIDFFSVKKAGQMCARSGLKCSYSGHSRWRSMDSALKLFPSLTI